MTEGLNPGHGPGDAKEGAALLLKSEVVGCEALADAEGKVGFKGSPFPFCDAVFPERAVQGEEEVMGEGRLGECGLKQVEFVASCEV